VQKTTRQRVLETIQRNQALSTHEIGLILGLTNANIRHHIVALKNDSLIEIVGRKHDSRGRPTHIYGLSEQFLGNGLDILSTILLEEYFDQVSESEQRRRLKALAKRLILNLGRGGNGAKSHQLKELTDKLNGIHFFTRWQAGALGAQITFLHCPYSQVIDDNPQLCILDNFILEEYIGLKVEQIEKLAPTLSGTRQCVFQIRDT
jgi:predicted ArsR family transcriptional regulator